MKICRTSSNVEVAAIGAGAIISKTNGVFPSTTCRPLHQMLVQGNSGLVAEKVKSDGGFKGSIVIGVGNQQYNCLHPEWLCCIGSVGEVGESFCTGTTHKVDAVNTVFIRSCSSSYVLSFDNTIL